MTKRHSDPPPGNTYVSIYDEKPKTRGPYATYDPSACDFVRDCAQVGMSMDEWCAGLGVSRAVFHDWCRKHPEFREAVKIADVLERAYWARMVREARLGKGYMPPTIVAFNAERRFPETWGREGNKNQVRAMIADIEAADATTAPEEKHLDAMDHDEVLARIAELEARRGKTPK